MSKSNGEIGCILEGVRNAIAVQSCCQVADHELLERYVAAQEGYAFAALAKRHGSMVMGLCWRILRHQQDAEDAFQAAFLVFARKAGTIRKSESIASWLHSVAFRAANKLRASQARRRARCQTQFGLETLLDVSQADFSRDLSFRETQRVLEEELNRLADKYRAPLLLCCVEGRTRDEAAQQLGWSLGVLRGRLDRGRELLRARLVRRGLSLSVALLALGVAGTSHAAVTPALLSSTVQAATGAARSQSAAGAVSAQATALAQGVIQAMFLAKVKIIAVGLLTLTFLGAGAGFVTYQAQAQDGQPVARVQPKRDAKQPPVEAMDAAQLKREIERLRLELEQTRLLLKLANQEILELRAARAEAAALEKPDRDAAELATKAAKALEHDSERARIARDAAIAGEKEALIRYQRAKLQHNRGAISDEELGSAELTWKKLALEALASRKPVKDLDRHLGVFSPDRKVIAGAQGKNVTIFDAETGKELRRFSGHSEEVSGLAFAPDGKILASGSTDKTVVLWDIRTGKQIAMFSHQEPVVSVFFGTDGRHVVVRGKSMTSEIDATTGKLNRVTKNQKDK
jgi:RNA polymerase sigma factor (sigma-70 family)